MSIREPWEPEEFDRIAVGTGSSQLQSGRRAHAHIRPDIYNDEEGDDEPGISGDPIPLNEIFR